VDPAEVPPVNAALEQRGWSLDYIFNTHHHFDHTGGNLQLKKQFQGLQIVGPRADAGRIPGIDIQVGDGDSWQFGELEFKVFDTPGHTRGHIAYWVPEAKALFPGDTLFALGCGRLFEGDPKTMWSSLSKLLPLPADTLVYCAHEYTQSNARFAVSVDPNNTALQERKKRIDDARSKGEPTVPSLLGEELQTNPFLRPHDSGIRSAVKADNSTPDWEVFGRVRTAKDKF
jgi:hydroxyacylglutathione hydrolase